MISKLTLLPFTGGHKPEKQIPGLLKIAPIVRLIPITIGHRLARMVPILPQARLLVVSNWPWACKDEPKIAQAGPKLAHLPFIVGNRLAKVVLRLPQISLSQGLASISIRLQIVDPRKPNGVDK